MSEEKTADEEPVSEVAEDAAQASAWQEVNIRSSIAEVIALHGAQAEAANDDEDRHKQIEEAPIVRLANTILQCAIKEKASDIYVEPERDRVCVRYRVDGVAYEVMQMPRYILAPLTRRYKILADVNIIEYRVPQQGQIGTRYAGTNYTLRLNTLPTLHGEKTVIHVSEANGAKLNLEQIGLLPEVQAQIEDQLSWRRGMLLITGGNGQGKTTTQYALLNRLNTVDLSIFAVAPGYDYTLPGITQARLNPRIGYTAEVALASIADLSAEVVALDSCRAKEATQIALSMAAANVLVLQTLTASNTISALRFMMDSAEPELVAEGLSGILAQMLVRRICGNCKEDYEVTAQDLRRFGYAQDNPQTPVQIARGTGCEMCRNTGYRGRIGLFELVTMNDDIAAAIAYKTPQAQLEQVIRQTNPVTMRKDGLIKILQGITTPEEVVRAVAMRM